MKPEREALIELFTSPFILFVIIITAVAIVATCIEESRSRK